MLKTALVKSGLMYRHLILWYNSLWTTLRGVARGYIYRSVCQGEGSLSQGEASLCQGRGHSMSGGGVTKSGGGSLCQGRGHYVQGRGHYVRGRGHSRHGCFKCNCATNSYHTIGQSEFVEILPYEGLPALGSGDIT